MREKQESAEASEPLGGMPDADNVASRAAGRPPEEQTSEDPEAQADAVLQDSEDRMAEGADRADR
jgi:hypothetical protein